MTPRLDLIIHDNKAPTAAPIGPTKTMFQAGIHKKLSTPVDPWLKNVTEAHTYVLKVAIAISQPHPAADRPDRNTSQAIATGTRLQPNKPTANRGAEATSYATAKAGTHAATTPIANRRD